MKHFLPFYPSFVTSRISFSIVSKDYFNYLEERGHDYGWPMTKLTSIRCRHATEFPERMRSAADSLQAISTLNETFPTLLPCSMAQSLSSWQKIGTTLSIFQPVSCRSHIRCLVLYSLMNFFLTTVGFNEWETNAKDELDDSHRR
jgi:hypothetical protein